jgi:hypothetical protein
VVVEHTTIATDDRGVVTGHLSRARLAAYLADASIRGVMPHR